MNTCAKSRLSPKGRGVGETSGRCGVGEGGRGGGEGEGGGLGGVLKSSGPISGVTRIATVLLPPFSGGDVNVPRT